MDELDLPIVNRSAAVILFGQPYVDWANKLPDRSPEEKKRKLTVEDVNLEPTVYLVPEIYDPEEWDAYLETHWPVLFDHLLAGWTTDDTLWPKCRTLEMFDEWFAVSILSVVQDLPNKEPLGYVED